MSGVINDIKLTDRSFSFLALQRGGLHDLRTDKVQWAAAYRNDLLAEFMGIKPYLPLTCPTMLDVGSGLGGLDMLIHRYYKWGRGGCKNWLLDGREYCGDLNAGEVDHDTPFNDEQVTRAFWQLNGCQLSGYVDAESLYIPEGITFDIILSTQSWCFHYEPDTFLELVKAHTSQDVMLILDVRKNKPKWHKQLEKYFKCTHVLADKKKYQRTIWRSW